MLVLAPLIDASTNVPKLGQLRGKARNFQKRSITDIKFTGSQK
jgi:hypothetical protein